MWTMGFVLSYTAYDTELSSNSCNINAYICWDFEVGYRRIFINSDGLLNEDDTFKGDSAQCLLYDFDQDTSESEIGEPPTSEVACQAVKVYLSDLEKYASEYKKCKENNSCSNDPLSKFTHTEEKLSAFCNSVYNTSYYSDSCSQTCVSVDSKIVKIKTENGIEVVK